MKLLPFLALSLFCNHSFANLDTQQNVIHDPSVAETLPTASMQVRDTFHRKAEAKKVAYSAKRDFKNRISLAWIIPAGNTGKTILVRVALFDTGQVQSIVTTKPSGNKQLDESILEAIKNTAPFPMPSDPDARREARSFTASFTVK